MSDYEPAVGWKAEAEAWQDNYDGMFARWIEADLERLQLKDRVRDLELKVRLLEQDKMLEAK